MSKKNLFITGATGAIGKYLLAQLLEEGYTVSALIRPQSYEKNLSKIYAFLQKEGFAKEKNQRIIPIKGDVINPNLGLSSKEYSHLTKRITHILHCAANTKFSLQLDEARLVNVEGTRHVIEFAKSCKNLQKLGYLSTIYVSGRRQGKILETDLIDTSFVNTYEQSKFEAEKLLHKNQNSLPIVVYRLSTIIGDSRDGTVPGFNSVHKALRLYYRGLAPMVPGVPKNIADLISVDYAAKVISYLFSKKFTSSTTYHLVAEKKDSFTLEELVEATSKLFRQLSPKWRLKSIEKPPIVTYKTFELFEQSVIEADDALMLEIIKIMKYFIPHMSYETYFDTTNTDRDLLPSIKQKHIKEYYEKIISYCISTNWGKTDYDSTTI